MPKKDEVGPFYTGIVLNLDLPFGWKRRGICQRIPQSGEAYLIEQSGIEMNTVGIAGSDPITNKAWILEPALAFGWPTVSLEDKQQYVIALQIQGAIVRRYTLKHADYGE